MIHYHFDGKYNLISSFLKYLIDQYENQPEIDEATDLWEALHTRFDQCLFGPDLGDDFDH